MAVAAAVEWEASLLVASLLCAAVVQAQPLRLLRLLLAVVFQARQQLHQGVDLAQLEELHLHLAHLLLLVEV